MASPLTRYRPCSPTHSYCPFLSPLFLSMSCICIDILHVLRYTTCLYAFAFYIYSCFTRPRAVYPDTSRSMRWPESRCMTWPETTSLICVCVETRESSVCVCGDRVYRRYHVLYTRVLGKGLDGNAGYDGCENGVFLERPELVHLCL